MEDLHPECNSEPTAAATHPHIVPDDAQVKSEEEEDDSAVVAMPEVTIPEVPSEEEIDELATSSEADEDTLAPKVTRSRKKSRSKSLSASSASSDKAPSLQAADRTNADPRHKSGPSKRRASIRALRKFLAEHRESFLMKKHTERDRTQK